MRHPIKRLRHKIDTGEVRFEINTGSRFDMLDILCDVRAAIDAAYEQACQMEGDAMPTNGFRFAEGKLIAL